MSQPKKRCARCGLWKRLSKYSLDAHRKMGVRANCKDCETVLRGKQSDPDAAIILKIQKKWQAEGWKPPAR